MALCASHRFCVRMARINKRTTLTTIALLTRIRGNAADVFDRVATLDGIAAWFTKATSDSYTEGGCITLHFSGEEPVHFEVSTIRPHREIVWRCVSDENMWAGTQIRFTFVQDGTITTVRFDHEGWSEITDIFRDCAMSWTYFMHSLRQLVETGKGTPEGGVHD